MLTINLLLQMCRVTIAVNRNAGEGAVNIVKIVGQKFDQGRVKVFFKAMQLNFDRNRNDPRLLRQ